MRTGQGRGPWRQSSDHEKATLGGGCFWCLEAVFGPPGVKRVVSGYAGGTVPSPTYAKVCSGSPDIPKWSRSPMIPAVVPFESCSRRLRDPRPDDHESPGARRRHAVPFDHLLPHAAAAGEGSAEDRRAERERGSSRGPIVTELAPAEEFYPCGGLSARATTGGATRGRGTATTSSRRSWRSSARSTWRGSALARTSDFGIDRKLLIWPQMSAVIYRNVAM